jgi:hypothetical protein
MNPAVEDPDLAFLSALAAVLPGLAQDQSRTATKPDARVFREPFTLRLQIDKDHYYEERYDKAIPYVSDNDVYLFSGENFGVSLTPKRDAFEVTYQPDFKEADVWFSFQQPKELGEARMMLIIQNKTKRELRMDALMTVPGKNEIYKTSVVPIGAGLTDYETWPHPIVQLVLRNLRFSENKAGKSKN